MNRWLLGRMTATTQELNPISTALCQWGGRKGKDEGRRGEPGAWRGLSPRGERVVLAVVGVVVPAICRIGICIQLDTKRISPVTGHPRLAELDDWRRFLGLVLSGIAELNGPGEGRPDLHDFAEIDSST